MTWYKIKALRGKVSSLSMTEPVRGTLDAVLKQDSDNSPTCVYNEVAALRLAQRAGVPLAMGVPSVGDGGVYFASLTVGGLSINLPNVSRRRMEGVAKRYPNEAAGIFVFDVWILNDDREHNLKANLTVSPLHLVAAIDHEQTLLGRYADMLQSLEALEGMEAPRNHPLGGHVQSQLVDRWIALIQAMSDDSIDDALVLRYSVGGVHQRSQGRLARAMKQRRDQLSDLVAQALG